MSEPVGGIEFAPEDFAYLAKYLRRIPPSNDTGVKVLLSRLDVNIILAALDAMSEDRE